MLKRLENQLIFNTLVQNLRKMPANSEKLIRLKYWKTCRKNENPLSFSGRIPQLWKTMWINSTLILITFLGFL